MAITVVPTLDFMADVYRRSARGGADSPRFRAYAQAAAARLPVHGYNPMTSRPVLPTVEALLAIDAEALVADVATAVAARLGDSGDHTMHLTVATPGMWTDRLATEVDHRLAAPDPGGVLWWYDEPVTRAAVAAAAAAQAVRMVSVAREGPPSTLAAAARQEGAAMAAAGGVGEWDPAAEEALDVLGDDTARSTMVAWLYGDEAARALGYTPLGLAEGAGSRHAAALAAQAKARVSIGNAAGRLGSSSATDPPPS